MKKSFLAAAILMTLGVSVIRANSTPTIQKMSPNPICFTENKGQWHEDVKFRCDAGGAIVWICKDRIVYQYLRHVERSSPNVSSRALSRHSRESRNPAGLGDRDGHPYDEPDSMEQLVITAKFVNPNPDAQVIGEAMMEYKCNYFIGNDPNQWHTDVPNYEAVTLENVYDGVDLRLFAGESGTLLYRYDIAPGADQERIKFEYEGLERTTHDDNGRIVAQTRWGEISGLLSSPSIAAEFSGPQSKEQRFSTETNLSAFYNPQAVELVFSTFVGGSSTDYGMDIAVDGVGCVYVTGYTGSPGFPTQDAHDASFNGGFDCFVTKLSSPGSNLIYSTFVGGSDWDWGLGVAVDDEGCVYVSGETHSLDFPIQNAFDADFDGGADNCIFRLSSQGNSLIFSTYLGGSLDDHNFGIGIDGNGNTSVTGYTNSTNFPTHNAHDESYNGNEDAFVTKISSSGNNLIFSTYLGGASRDVGLAIAVDDAGNSYVTGFTGSDDFPTQVAFDSTSNNRYDAFAVKLTISGSISYSTYLGGGLDDLGYGIAVDAGGSAYLAGYTVSSNFPLQNAYDASYNGGGNDLFVTKLSRSGSSLIYSTFLGGSSGEEANSIAVDAAGSAYVVGSTGSPNFPVLNSYDSDLGGNVDVYVTKFSDQGNNLVYSTFLGGSNIDYGYGITVDNERNVFACGIAFSTDFPTLNAFDMSHSGDRDVFVVKLSKTMPCGDADEDGHVTVSDPVCIINYAFFSDAQAAFHNSGDADCNGIVSISDAVYLINYIFSGGAAPCAACP